MFYYKFVSLCQQRGESIAHVCKQVGIFPTTAHDWKSGATPRNSTVKRIADYFNVDVSYFYGDDIESKDDHLVEGFIEEMRNKDRLTDDEQLLLDMFRSMTDEQKNALMKEAMRIKLK